MKTILIILTILILPLHAEDPDRDTESNSAAKPSSSNSSRNPSETETLTEPTDRGPVDNTRIEFPSLPMVVKRKGQFITYKADIEGSKQFKGIGYLVLPEGASAENPAPGIVVVHRWWGQTEYTRKRAEMLADLGYVAFAIDMYGDGQTANTIADAGQLMYEVSCDYRRIEDRFMIGMRVLQQQPQVDSTKIASVGYSLGGKMAMQAAAINPANLLGVVVFHGAPDIDIGKGIKEIKPKILICNGADDTLIIQESLDDFEEDIANIKTDITWELYPGVINGFTNPDSDRIHRVLGTKVAYNEEADKKSWNSMQKFLKNIFSEQENLPISD